MKEYILATARDPASFEDVVNGFLSEGFVRDGHPFVFEGQLCQGFLQEIQEELPEEETPIDGKLLQELGFVMMEQDIYGSEFTLVLDIDGHIIVIIAPNAIYYKHESKRHKIESLEDLSERIQIFQPKKHEQFQNIIRSRS